MIGYSTLETLFTRLTDNKLISKIYHSVVFNTSTDGSRKPSAFVNGMLTYVGPDDSKGFYSYCRQTGPGEVTKEERVGSSWKLYKVRVPFKMVFFNSFEERDHEEILRALIGIFANTDKISISRVHTIQTDILNSEVPGGSITFTQDTFYKAIDFFVLLDIQGTSCNFDIGCNNISNPFGAEEQ